MTGGARPQSAASAAPRPGERRMISPLLLENAQEGPAARLLHSVDDLVAVLVELDVTHGTSAARAAFDQVWAVLFHGDDRPAPVAVAQRYLQCWLTTEEIGALARADREGPHSIFRLWPDFRIRPHIDRSVATVKADAAARSYGTSGAGIVWAVVDSGIDGGHAHFNDPVVGPNLQDDVVKDLHRDFTALLRPPAPPSQGPAIVPAGTTAGAAARTDKWDPAAALVDPLGHGTHVAGIIAGTMPVDGKVVIAVNEPTGDGLPAWGARMLEPGRSLTSMAPRTRLVSLRVLDENGNTSSSVVIAALDYVREVNADGRRAIHGVNLSLGCDWYPDEYAAGQSPLCLTVDDLVASGVVVVVSAGNSGAGGTLTGASGDVTGQLSTITDPGNADRAITVGSSHRFAPHTYGVSYTSSKGPTLDGRLKPDLVAPGERITSAATGAMRDGVPVFTDGADGAAPYVEESGTSMAAPHVSGAIAAFLSVRPEFVGQADEIKRLFCANATSLGRHEFYQGAGLLDLMRVLSNV